MLDSGIKEGRTDLNIKWAKSKGSDAERGYSLLEVLIALLLAGMTTGVITVALQQSTHLQSMLDGRITVTVLGMSKLAELEARSEKLSSGEFPPPYRRYQWVAQEERTDGGSPVINLTIKWSGGNQHSQQKVFKGFPISE